jgi:hypothetical protein
MPDKKIVSIHPSSFADESEQDRLSDMSLESSFLLYYRRRQETSKEDRDKSIRIHCRQVVKGIVPVLRLLSYRSGVSEGEFALCISFKILAELQGIGVVGAVGKSYSSLLTSSVKSALFDDLGALDSDYNISRRDGKIQRLFPVVPEVYSALEKVSDGCGTALPKLYQVGLMLALTKSEQAMDGGDLYKAVTEVFKPEIFDFLRYMARWRKTLEDGLWW